MDGKTVVITGGNSRHRAGSRGRLGSYGRDGDHHRAQRGSRRRPPARDRGPERQRLRGDGTRPRVVRVDRAFAEQVRRHARRLDVLVLNAGGVLADRRADRGRPRAAVPGEPPRALPADAPAPRPGRRSRRRRGSWSSRRPRTRASRAPSTSTTSKAHRTRYRAFQTYYRTKLMNILFTRELARRLDGTGVTANSLHPGFVASKFAREGDLSWWGNIGMPLDPPVLDLAGEGRADVRVPRVVARASTGSPASTSPSAAVAQPSARGPGRRRGARACGRSASELAGTEPEPRRFSRPRQTHATSAIGTTSSAVAGARASTWSAPTTSEPSTAVGFVHRPDERHSASGSRPIERADGSDPPAASEPRCPPSRRARRDFEPERDRRRQVHVDATRRVCSASRSSPTSSTIPVTPATDDRDLRSRRRGACARAAGRRASAGAPSPRPRRASRLPVRRATRPASPRSCRRGPGAPRAVVRIVHARTPPGSQARPRRVGGLAAVAARRVLGIGVEARDDLVAEQLDRPLEQLVRVDDARRAHDQLVDADVGPLLQARRRSRRACRRCSRPPGSRPRSARASGRGSPAATRARTAASGTCRGSGTRASAGGRCRSASSSSRASSRSSRHMKLVVTATLSFT